MSIDILLILMWLSFGLADSFLTSLDWWNSDRAYYNKRFEELNGSVPPTYVAILSIISSMPVMCLLGPIPYIRRNFL